MENEINNNYIEEALTELIPILGTREPIDHEKIISLIYSKEIKKAIKAIALILGLPVEVNISYVSKGYRPTVNDGFQSTHLVKTDWRGRGTSNIIAQVSIPSNLPLYGTSGMSNFPINVRLSENCVEYPATLISVMAHELSHVVLYSMWHKEKENEFYTDLTAMILGFSNIMRTGRKVTETSTSIDRGILSNTTTTHTETTTYGYLSDENFDFAFNKIENVLNKHKSAKKKRFKTIKQFQKRVNKTKKCSLYFVKYLEYLDKNLNKEITQEDGYKIGVFHQSGYADNFKSVLQENEIILKKFLKFVKNLKSYTEQNIKIMEQYEAQSKSASEELTKEYFLIQKDINILKKYVSFFYRLKLKFF